MQTMARRQNQQGSADTREEREQKAIEKIADLFKQAYGPAIKELEKH